MLHFSDMANEAASNGVSAESIMAMEVVKPLSRMKEIKEGEIEKQSKELVSEIDSQFKKLMSEQGVVEAKVNE